MGASAWKMAPCATLKIGRNGTFDVGQSMRVADLPASRLPEIKVKLEQDYEGARQREASFKNSQARKKNWLTRKWRASPSGNSYINVDGYNVVVFPDHRPRPQSWSFRVTNRRTGRPGQSRKPYPSEEAAKLRAFDALMWMKDKGR
jgi:hypothetical protein